MPSSARPCNVKDSAIPDYGPSLYRCHTHGYYWPLGIIPGCDGQSRDCPIGRAAGGA